MKTDYKKQFHDIFQRLANVAGKIAPHYFRSDIEIETKNDLSPVTQADRAIEHKLCDIVAATLSAHSFIGEEFGSYLPDAGFVWVVDPIDGTRAFMTGKPLFGKVIGLMHQRQTCDWRSQLAFYQRTVAWRYRPICDMERQTRQSRIPCQA